MVTVCLTVMEVGAETGENWEGCRERERGRGERSDGERIGKVLENW